jgi:nitrite reductase (NO-forming)
MVFIGVGGVIDGQVNPVLSAAEGQVVQITLINGEGAEHDIVFPDQNARSPRITGRGSSTTLAFRAERAGDFTYLCSVPGHELAGMKGQFLVTPRPPAQTVVEAIISREATDLPQPIGPRAPQTVRVDLITVELEGRLAEGATFGYWTFNGKVPGPFLRVRVGDTVDVHIKNAADSSMIHSVDFHAATGPGGGAAATQVDPGHEKTVKFKALVPGIYVYHCATPMVAHHIANGMYGLILVEPEGGLPPIDHEFYVMQGEIYTEAAFGQLGSQEFSVEALARTARISCLMVRLELCLSHPRRRRSAWSGSSFGGRRLRVVIPCHQPKHCTGCTIWNLRFSARGVQTMPCARRPHRRIQSDVQAIYILVDMPSRLERGWLDPQVEGQPDPEILKAR